MYDLDDLRRRVRDLRGNLGELVALSGMSRSWVSKFGVGGYDNPGIKTVERISDALDTIERARHAYREAVSPQDEKGDKEAA